MPRKSTNELFVCKKDDEEVISGDIEKIRYYKNGKLMFSLFVYEDNSITFVPHESYSIPIDSEIDFKIG